MKKLISLLGLLFLATAVFAQTFTLKTADKNPCKITLDGDFIIIEETLLGGYINRITLPKTKFTAIKTMVPTEEGCKSVINNPPYMETTDNIYIVEEQNNPQVIGYLSSMAVYQQKIIMGIWLNKKDIEAIAKKLKL
ncbi:hypothetical protein DYE49_07595 [Treponema rectale]|uniref:DUF4367 domain-containing protein n=1 Tax=Treponema rectale TaxID=744512 RepID=A0A840SDE3_9SPIR|nr:hypothetical protein [Treponema rectale]MBB5217956.1 hypothetical protein [Treponema rectale]QOS40326.1 hypothetical protein DYE49_07595 [Treponema rectale]